MRLFWLFLIFAGCTTTPRFADERHTLPEYMRSPASGPAPKPDYKFDESDTSCGGFPRMKVETFPGSCLGMVLPKARSVDPITRRGFSMPRTMVQIPGTRDFLVVDMGSWHMGKGAIFRMAWDGSRYSVRVVKEGLNYPHSIKRGPDGKFWINELNEISRFSLDSAGLIVGWEKMVVGLPAFPETDAHPLTQFAFDPRSNDIYLNLGAPSDHCLTPGSPSECPEVKGNDLSSIVRVSWASLQRPPVRSWIVVARGLRNSVALAVSPTGLLIQGENGRDFSDSTEPFEEMNVIDPAKPAFNHGWPYCYDFRAKSPEWEKNTAVKCDIGTEPTRAGDYAEPYILIPPHAAPLTAGYYHGPMFPALEGKLLMTWHGYRKRDTVSWLTR